MARGFKGGKWRDPNKLDLFPKRIDYCITKCSELPMSKRLTVFALTAMTLIGQPIGGFATEPEPKPKLARDDPNRIICRRETVTGYYSVTRKVCMTRAEWIERSQRAQQEGQRVQEQGLINSCRSADRSGC